MVRAKPAAIIAAKVSVSAASFPQLKV